MLEHEQQAQSRRASSSMLVNKALQRKCRSAVRIARNNTGTNELWNIANGDAAFSWSVTILRKRCRFPGSVTELSCN
jgi:hypothetical protein